MSGTTPNAPPTHLEEDSEPGKIGIVEGALQGGAMVLNLVQQASKLSGLPYLSGAAGLALSLVQVAQAVKENKEGFQELVDDATKLVAVFYRSYQGAQNQKEWLNGDGIRATAKDLERCLNSIHKLGEKMNKRGLLRRAACYVIDAGTIKKYRQRLSSTTTQFEIAAQLDSRDILVQILKNQDELMNEVKHLSTSPGAGIPAESPAGKAIENENRARRRIQIENVKASGVAMGSGSVVVENGRAREVASDSRSPTPQRQKDKQGSAALSPYSQDISLKGIENSGISLGDGDVWVSNSR